jgi:hypothetical protein
LQWSVTRPKWSTALHQNTFHSWALQPNELAKVNKDFNAKAITCKVCSSAFSLTEGVKESFVSEHPFLIHDYQSNTYDSGMMKGKVGLAVFVTFSKHFDMKPEARTASSGKNMEDLLHVVIGGGCCFLWIAAALTRAQIGRVPVPPVVLGVRLLKVVVML